MILKAKVGTKRHYQFRAIGPNREVLLVRLRELYEKEWNHSNYQIKFIKKLKGNAESWRITTSSSNHVVTLKFEDEG